MNKMNSSGLIGGRALSCTHLHLYHGVIEPHIPAGQRLDQLGDPAFSCSSGSEERNELLVVDRVEGLAHVQEGGVHLPLSGHLGVSETFEDEETVVRGAAGGA